MTDIGYSNFELHDLQNVAPPPAPSNPPDPQEYDTPTSQTKRQCQPIVECYVSLTHRLD